MESNQVRLIECPRDAMQGWKDFIPTATKIEYLNTLLEVGFHTIDFGSFVSPKAIPQMADTKEVLAGIRKYGTTRLLAIIANLRGAEEACSFPAIDFLGFPFSVSETFQQRNTNSSIASAYELLKNIQQLCTNSKKQLVVYISMGFGNPYGDPYSAEIVQSWAEKIAGLGVDIISLADTVGVADPVAVGRLTSFLIKEFPGIETGVHLHATPYQWADKAQAALDAGCRRIDSAMKGIGGCPMANDDLVGNLDTEMLISYLRQRNLLVPLNEEALSRASAMANMIFQSDNHSS
ncbi:MAG TPA: hydroxymethylglutaryl-CoA lyase [Flavitalea sp.]|nr:hydroxymethylglutaryl-CoA lyase [Flavitalea sp.]